MPRTGKPIGRPRDQRNLQKQHGVSLPEQLEVEVQTLAKEKKSPVVEVIRELVAAGLAASR